VTSTGVEYLTETATTRVIRDQAIYAGVRVAMDCNISMAITVTSMNGGQ
jgi:hypothetical protein